MSDIQIETQLGPLSRTDNRRGSTSSSRQAGANKALAWVLIVMVALGALPFGSVYGFTWGLFAVYAGLAALVYVLALARSGETLRVPLSSIALQTSLFGIMLAYLVVQILPLGGLLGPFTAPGGVAVTSNTISINADMTLLMLVRQLTYGLFFLLVLQVTQNAARRRFFLDAILIVIVAYAGLAVVSLQMGDTVLGVTKKAYEGSATGPFINRNSFATFLAFGAVIAMGQLGRCIVDQSERHPHDGRVAGNFSSMVLYAIAYAALVGVAFATQSRMGVFVTLAGSGLVAIIVIFRSVRSRVMALLTVALGIVAAIAGFLLMGEGLVNRLFDVERSQEERLDLYYQVLELIGMRPLTGYGGGAFEMAYPLVHRPPTSPDLIWDKAHNTYLTLWTELGLIVGSIPMILLAWAGWRLVAGLRNSSEGWVARTIALAALLIAAIHSLVDFSLEIQANTFVFLALIGAGLTTTVAPRRT